MSVLSRRGPYANQPAKLPALQTVRANASLSEIATAVERLREWVEVRLGARGDKFERAVTERDLSPRLDTLKTELLARIAEVEASIPDGTTTSATSGTRTGAPSTALAQRIATVERGLIALQAQVQALIDAPAVPAESLTLLPPQTPDPADGLDLSPNP